MVGSQTALSILDEAAAAIGGWTALQSIKCVHLDSEGQNLGTFNNLNNRLYLARS
jgi:hypothetical protein